MKKYLGIIISIIIYLMIGGVSAIEFIGLMPQIISNHTLIEIITMLLLLYIIMMLHIFIHELGHLLTGLVSGYQFVSYRIFSWIIVKQDGKLRWKKQSIPGLAGQCLLEPDDMDENTPVLLYNLGGILANIIVAIFSYGIAMLIGDESFITAIFKVIGFVGIMLAILNGMVVPGVANDGYNVYELIKIKKAKRALLAQLKVNAYQVQGIRLKDMDAAYFFDTTPQDRKSSLLGAIAVFRANRYMDAHQFDEAYPYMQMLLKEDNNIVELHKVILKMECAFCEMLSTCQKEVVDQYLDKTTQQIMKTMKENLAVVRIQYAYALLVEDDQRKAKQLLEAMQKYEMKTPFESEIRSERELIQLIDQKYQNKLLAIHSL